MPKGYPDYSRKVLADIVAQTLEKLAIDIAAQTLDKLKVDVIAQTLETLGIDIKAQTIEELMMNIKAQAIGVADRPQYASAQEVEKYLRYVKENYTTAAEAAFSGTVTLYTVPAERTLLLTELRVFTWGTTSKVKLWLQRYDGVTTVVLMYREVGGGVDKRYEFPTPIRIPGGWRLQIRYTHIIRTGTGYFEIIAAGWEE